MKISVRGWLVVCAFAVAVAALTLLTSPFLHADDGESQSGKLTQESLENLLKAMGLQPTQEKQRYDFSFKAIYGQEEWDLTMSAVLSADGETVWVMAWLDELPKSATDVPRTAVLRLLADNDRLGGGKFFAYIASNRRFVLERVVANDGMTTAKFRAILQDLGGSVVETYAHWSVDNWKASGAAATTAQSANSSKAAKATEESDATDEATAGAPNERSGKSPDEWTRRVPANTPAKTSAKTPAKTTAKKTPAKN